MRGPSLGQPTTLVRFAPRHRPDKTGLVRAALQRIESQDLAQVAGDPDLAPEDRLRDVLRRVAAPEYLTTDYLSLRLQLWSLAQAHPDFAKLNASAPQRYRDRLADLITAARPDLDADECARRAAGRRRAERPLAHRPARPRRRVRPARAQTVRAERARRLT